MQWGTYIQPKLNPSAGSQNRTAWSATVYGFGSHEATSPKAERTRKTANPTMVYEMIMAAGCAGSISPFVSSEGVTYAAPTRRQCCSRKRYFWVRDLTWTMLFPYQPSNLFEWPIR